LRLELPGLRASDVTIPFFRFLMANSLGVTSSYALSAFFPIFLKFKNTVFTAIPETTGGVLKTPL